MRGQALVGLIKVAGIDVVLWRIHDYASDALEGSIVCPWSHLDDMECNCILSAHQGGVYCNKMKLLMGSLPLCCLAIDDLVDLLHCTTDENLCGNTNCFERGNAKSGYQDESMQDNECDNGELAKMSSSDDFFSENI
eukprot:scaffold106873_cov72-Attheya_sp.AAC.1